MTPDDLQRGKLEQSCPDCGRWEAAGSYCSKCYRPMGAVDWYRNGDQTRRRSVARGDVGPPISGPLTLGLALDTAEAVA